MEDRGRFFDVDFELDLEAEIQKQYQSFLQLIQIIEIIYSVDEHKRTVMNFGGWSSWATVELMKPLFFR